MKNERLTLALPIVALAALFAMRDGSVIPQVLAVLLAGPIIAWPLRRINAPVWIPGLTAAGAAWLLELPLHDRLALVATAALVNYARPLWAKITIASIGMMIVAGYPPLEGSYVVSCGVYGAFLFAWLVTRHRRTLDRMDAAPAVTGRLAAWIAFHAVFATILAAVVIISMVPLEQWIVEQLVGQSHLHASGFGAVTDLNSISEIQKSNKIALRLFARGPRMLRGQVFTIYRRGLWRAAAIVPGRGRIKKGTKIFAFYRHPGRAAARGNLIERVECQRANTRTFFLPLGGRLLEAPDCRVERSRVGVLISTPREIRSYLYDRPKTLPSPDAAPADGTLYLHLHPEFPATVRRLATTWTQGKTSPRAKAEAILNHLVRNYRYTLKPGRPGKKEDAIERFLLRTRAGHCQYFASAMTLLLRCVGVHSRSISGFSVTERNPFGGYFIARNADAHAWVEAWLPGEGWVTFDPTPPDWQGQSQSRLSLWLYGAWDFVGYEGGRLRARLSALVSDGVDWFYGLAFSHGGLTLLAVLLALGGLAYAAWRTHWLRLILSAWFARTRARSASGADRRFLLARAALAELESLLAPLGIRRSSTATAGEFLDRILGTSTLTDESKAFAASILRAFSRCRYRGDPWNEDEIQAWMAALRKERKKR